MNDRLERYVEVILAVGVTGASIFGLYEGYLGGREAMILIMSSFALYQSTSIAKILKVMKGGEDC